MTNPLLQLLLWDSSSAAPSVAPPTNTFTVSRLTATSADAAGSITSLLANALNLTSYDSSAHDLIADTLNAVNEAS